MTRPITEAVAEFQRRGIKFEPLGAGGRPAIDDGAVKLAFFADPDGNRLYLCEA